MLVGAVIQAQQQAAALATGVYTLVTVPLSNPRDCAHVIPRALAAVLVAIGFTMT